MSGFPSVLWGIAVIFSGKCVNVKIFGIDHSIHAQNLINVLRKASPAWRPYEPLIIVNCSLRIHCSPNKTMIWIRVKHSFLQKYSFLHCCSFFHWHLFGYIYLFWVTLTFSICLRIENLFRIVVLRKRWNQVLQYWHLGGSLS